MKDEINALVAVCHQNSEDAGWWPEFWEHEQSVIGMKLMLIVSEIAEAMEGHRKNLCDDHLPSRKMMEVELADAIIRICDLAGALGFDLGGAVEEKLAYNAIRADHKPSTRAGEHGKKY